MDDARSQWTPASLLAIAQLVVLIAGGIYTWAKLENSSDNTKKLADSLQQIVTKNRERTDDLNNRMIRVEVSVDAMVAGLRELDRKFGSGR